MLYSLFSYILMLSFVTFISFYNFEFAIYKDFIFNDNLSTYLSFDIRDRLIDSSSA